MPNARVFSSQAHLFAHLSEAPRDGLLALIAQYRADPRSSKIDVGVGVYRDEFGQTPIMTAVKKAEQQLLSKQDSKSYLGPEGDAAFVDCLKALVFGEELSVSKRLLGIQTPGGTGALRLAAELVARAHPQAAVWVGFPTWPNHEPILWAAHLKISAYRHFDLATQKLCFDELMQALNAAETGDIVLLHGCGHNPTGADLDLSQWIEIGAFMESRGLVPLIDVAYHGLGRGLQPDVAGLQAMLARVSEAIIAYSCSKNFGLYRDRVGALFVLGASDLAAQVALGNMLSLARPLWSMPPDHGAAIVRLILESRDLTTSWKAELEAMRRRIFEIRQQLSHRGGSFARLFEQYGMFCELPLGAESVEKLRFGHGIYMAGSGRINLAGLSSLNLDRFAEALLDVTDTILGN